MNTLISFMADWLLIIELAAGVGILVFGLSQDVRATRYQFYAQTVMAGLTAYVIAKYASVIYQPSALRPFEELGQSAGASYLNNPGFPSDHALLATFLVIAVWFGTRNKKLTIVFAIIALLVGIGRVLALVHTPVDIIGGVACALIGGLWYLQNSSKVLFTLSKSHKK